MWYLSVITNFRRLVTSQLGNALNLKNSIIKDDIDETVVAMCNLGNSVP